MHMAMLEAARAAALDLPGKDQVKADQYLAILRARDQWLRAASRFRDLDDLARELPGDYHSTVGPLRPGLALAFQACIGAELAVDLVYDRRRRRFFPLITRGVRGAACSDLVFYLGFSPDFLVLPCFHTHPTPFNELGYEMPSVADYWVLARLRGQLGGVCVCDRVFFPSGRHTVYGVDGEGRWFYRRQGRGFGYLPPQD